VPSTASPCKAESLNQNQHKHLASQEMAADTIVTDAFLKSVLESSKQAREQAIVLLDLATSTDSPPSLEAQIQISKQQKLLNSYLAQLRGLNRDATFGARDTKALTAEARQEVDRLHLQLQNLYYEQRHLQGEIAACEAYESVTTAHNFLKLRANPFAQS
jgi:THO complex subunit 5